MIFKIIYQFLKTGLLSIGGGLASFPYIREFFYVYSENAAAAESSFVAAVAAAQSLPGPIGINLASFSASSFGESLQQSFLYSLIACISIVFFPVLIVIIIQKLFMSKPIEGMFASVLSVLRPASAGLVVAAVLPLVYVGVFEGLFFNISSDNVSLAIIFFTCAFLFNKFKKIPVFCFIIFGAVFGELVFLIS